MLPLVCRRPCAGGDHGEEENRGGAARRHVLIGSSCAGRRCPSLLGSRSTSFCNHVIICLVPNKSRRPDGMRQCRCVVWWADKSRCPRPFRTSLLPCTAELAQHAHFQRIETANPLQPQHTGCRMDGNLPNSALENIHVSVSPLEPLGRRGFATPHHARGSILGNVMYQCKRKRAAASTHRRRERRGK